MLDDRRVDVIFNDRVRFYLMIVRDYLIDKATHHNEVPLGYTKGR